MENTGLPTVGCYAPNTGLPAVGYHARYSTGVVSVSMEVLGLPSNDKTVTTAFGQTRHNAISSQLASVASYS
jgi:hypothetical protein